MHLRLEYQELHFTKTGALIACVVMNKTLPCLINKQTLHF